MPCIPSVARDITSLYPPEGTATIATTPYKQRNMVETAVHEEYEWPQHTTNSPSIATAAIAVATNISWVWPGESPSLRKASNSTKGYDN